MGAFSAVLYGTTAVAMVFINKVVLSVYHFTESNVLLLLQMLTAVAVLHALHTTGLVHLEPLSWPRAKSLVPVAVLYNLNVAFALASLTNLNIPMYNTMKRLTPSLVLAHDYLLSGARVSTRTVWSVALTVSGCLVAGYNDLTFDPLGYATALVSCVLQAAYLIAVQQTGVEQGLCSQDLLNYNALLSAPPLLVVVILDGELAPAVGKLRAGAARVDFTVLLIASLTAGMLLNYSIFLCTKSNSALTTTVVGVLKGVAATGLGFVLLGGVVFSPLNALGILMNLVGGVWYTYIKYDEKVEKQRVASSIAAGVR